MSFEYENLENLNIQLIDGDRGKNYPKQSEFQESGYCLFLSAKNVTKSGFQFSEKVYVSEERHNLLRAGKLERYDIVLTTRGTIGNVAFYDNSVLDDVVRVNSGMLILRANTTVWNPRFLYFLFTSKIIQEQISSLTSGSAVPQLPAKDLRKFLLPKVPMGVQNYIVKVIGDLSDKLKINDQTNQTLGKVRTSPMCALRRLTGLDARRDSQQMALVLCKKHNTAGWPVSHALRGFHSNRLSALSDFDRPRHAFSQMP